MKHVKNECEKCLLFDQQKNACRHLSKLDKRQSYFMRLLNRFSSKKKISNVPLKSNEVGFEWNFTDGAVYVERNITHIRKCSYGIIVSEYLQYKNCRVLEIAPRYSRFLTQRQLELNDCEYSSISASKNDFKKGNTKGVDFTNKNVKIPGHFHAYTSQLTSIFENNYFDLIIGTQSFEHWKEIDICEEKKIDAYKAGIENCHAVLKKNGIFMQDVPIGHHGDNLFIFGNFPGIRQLFDKDKWENIEITEWGKYFAIRKKVNEWTALIKATKK